MLQLLNCNSPAMVLQRCLCSFCRYPSSPLTLVVHGPLTFLQLICLASFATPESWESKSVDFFSLKSRLKLQFYFWGSHYFSSPWQGQQLPENPSPVQEAGLVPVLPLMNLPFGMETPERGQIGKPTGCNTSLCRGSSSFLEAVQSCLLTVIPQLMNLAW